MTVRPIAALAGLLLLAGAVPAGAERTVSDGAPAGSRKDRGVGPERALPPRPPPIAPEAGGAATAVPRGGAAAPETRPVLVQGYVKSASRTRLVLSAPGTSDALTLSIEPETEVLAADEGVAVGDLKPGQLVRAALVPSGDHLVAVVVEVMPGEPPRSPTGALPPGKPSPGKRSPTNGSRPDAPPAR